MEATTNKRVKIQEVSKITPFSDQTTEVSLPLTYFDAFWFKLFPVERLFFYEITELTSDFFNSIILPKLKHSLSLTLLHYFPVAGNLMWPEHAEKPAVYYFPNDAVSVTVAESDADFNNLTGNRIIREALAFRPLTPQLSISDDKAAVIAIQITLFPNQGFSIGISTHHAVLDGKSSTMFMKAWAYMCKQLGNEEENASLLPELTPFFDRTVIKDLKGLDTVNYKRWQDWTTSDSDTNIRSMKVIPSFVDVNKLVRATFELTSEDIRKLRNKLMALSDYNADENKANQSKQLHLSTYVLTLAYTFCCIVIARKEEGNRNVTFGISADCRSRLDPPIPSNYFGNCLGRLSEAAKASDFMGENGIAFVAEKLSDLISKELKGRDIIERSEKKMEKLIEIMAQGSLSLSVSGSTHFDVYGSDFGWGRPKKVEVVSIDKAQAVSLAESRDGGRGAEIGVALEKQQMEAFTTLFENGLKELV